MRPRSFPPLGAGLDLSPKVLIVDDEDFFRKIIAMSFEREGFLVSQADNGEDAVKMSGTDVPDLILLDIVLPRLLGFEVCQTLRNDNRFARTAIIVISAKSYQPDFEKAAELGADAYLVKPFELQDLLNVAREHMNKRQNAS